MVTQPKAFRGSIGILLAASLCVGTQVYAAAPSGYASDVSAVQQASRPKVKFTGVVTDNLGTVVGATVKVKGTSVGTLTDTEGRFTIEAAMGDVLIISYVGYKPMEVKLTGKTHFDIHLDEDAQALDEVVVTALGISREKKALSYAMTEIKGDEIIKSSVVNPINALQGKVAGVQINMGAAGPQSSQRIMIRGNTSLSGNNQPVFVVDGVIIDNEVTKTSGDKFERDFGNDLKNLNSDDFESVSVLKGASATALYGSRASNGVILITTKKGKKGEGLGISVSQTEQWNVLYAFPDLQNEFGMGTTTVWGLKPDGTENRDISSGTNWGPRYDGKPYTMGAFKGIYKSYDDNLKDMYQTGRYSNTNIALAGGTEKSTYRLSYSNMRDKGVSLNNSFMRNSLSLNVSSDISKVLSVESGFNYIHSKGRNPSYQGGERSAVYDFAYAVPRSYDTSYWMKNYWNSKHDGYNDLDPFGYSKTLIDLLENNEYQREENYRGFANINLKLASWLKATLKGDLNHTYTKYEKQTLVTGKSNYDGAAYVLNESTKFQNKITAMITANHTWGDFSVSGSLGTERFDEKRSYHNSTTNNGLKVPGQFTLDNSVDPATTDAISNWKRKRMNSIFGFINADWKNQIYLDITDREDWSSALGPTPYNYSSFGASWLITETLRDKLPSAISYAKIRASYAIVGKDCDTYLKTDPGTFVYNNSQTDSKFNGGSYAYYKFSNNNLVESNLKPEKQHAVEIGLEYRMFDNRLGLDFAWYKTNTRNQILAIPIASESGGDYRIFNAGNIQNAGIEISIDGTPIQTKDWRWEVSVNFTRNRNKIISLAPDVPKYKLPGGGIDCEAWATVGGAYGDIYTSYAYKRDENGNKLLNSTGQWLRSGESTKVGSIQPKFLGGFSTGLTWKGITLSAIIDARFGGDIFSASYNYGMASGSLKSSLRGRDTMYGGLPRTWETIVGGETIQRTTNDGMIPDGVFQPGTSVKVKEQMVDISGMSYQEAYEKGYLQPISARSYYVNKYEWSTGIREASVHELSWIALREVSLYWDLPKKWLKKVFVKGATLGLIVRNVGYLYNSLPDNIHPEGLQNNLTSEFVEAGGNVYSRNIGFKLNLNF
ncbi:MAG: SusC/RagA family TonB-linked outer membrane protein [Mediterranea sp.]|jgi:iron complex outermembrane receptor protein|nr:SusC/RagA family TonB-linked outer membrane protein [Mediterranea sp.]